MVHAQLLRQVLTRSTCRPALMAALAIGLGTGSAHPRPARGQIDPSWQHLVDTYAAEYPAVYTDYDVEVEMLYDTHGRMSTRTKYRIQLAVFDVKRAQPYLDIVVPLYGEKVKHKKAWVIEKGGGLSGAAAEGGDFHERTIFGDHKELRVSIPGLREKGYATVEVETQGRGGPATFLDYARDIPVKKATYTIRKGWHFGDILLRGGMHRVSKKNMYPYIYAAEDIPARFTEPKVPESDQPNAGFAIVYRFWDWKNITDGYAEYLDKVEIPDELTRSVKDTLKEAPPREAVEALARFLDDPVRLRLDGGARSGIWWSDFSETIKARKASAFVKAVLAYRLLRALNIDAHMVLASSRYLTDLDWRIHSISQIDATLIWIPSISEDFLWDVAARWVPLGRAGSDLYPEMLVLDPDAEEATRDFPVDTGQHKESRSLELELGESGSLDGTLTCRFMSYPLEGGLDPWDHTVDLDKKVEAMLPTGVEATGIEWKEAGPRSMRCTPETPAVLEGHLTEEALPAGDTGWDVVPFIISLPRELAVLGDPDRKAPLLLDDSYQITDAVHVNIGNHQVVHLPDPETVRTRAGDFNTTWEQRPNGVVAVRRLTVDGSVIRLQDQSAVARLCKAWRESQSLAIRVD